MNTDDNFFGINSVVLRGSSIIGHNLAGHRDNLRTETNNLYGQRKICGGKTNLKVKEKSAVEKPISVVTKKICGLKTNLFGLRYNLQGTTNLGGHRPGIGTENWLVTE